MPARPCISYPGVFPVHSIIHPLLYELQPKILDVVTWAFGHNDCATQIMVFGLATCFTTG